MKRIPFLLLLLALPACRTEMPVPDPATGRLAVTLGTAATRSAAATEAEKRIWDAQFLLFDQRGDCCFWQRVAFPEPMETYRADLTVPAGLHDIWVVTNLAASLQDIPDVQSLLGQPILLTDNALVTGGETGLVMAGSVSRIPIGDNGTTGCRIDVRRLVSRVHVGSIRNALPGGVSVGNPVLQLSNIVADRNLEGTAAPSRWCNKLLDKGSDMTAQAPVSGTAIAPGATWECDARLYAFPNPVTQDVTGGSSFSPRKTRLVLRCEIEGTRCYYPVTLDLFEENTSYGVSLTLQRPGSDDPDKPVESGAYRFTVDPEPWGTPVTYTENL